MTIEHGKYRLTWVKGRPYAAWSCRDEAGEYKRPRFALDVAPSASQVELRAALIAFAAKQDAKEARLSVKNITDILDAYARDREADGKVMRPILSNIRMLKPFFGNMKPEDISKELCRSYTLDRHKAGCSGSTILTELGRLSSALNWAMANNIIDRREIPMFFPHKSQPKDRVLSPEEFWRWHDAAREPYVKLFLLLCILTGGRTGAILELAWDRVDFDNRVINLKAPRKVDILSKRVEKGRATVHMDSALLLPLREAQAGTPGVWVIDYQGRIGGHERPISSVKTALLAARDRAGLEQGVSPHTLRHTFATWCENGQVPSHEIAKAMGHARASITEANYMHGAADLTKGAVGTVSAMLGAPGLKVVKKST